MHGLCRNAYLPDLRKYRHVCGANPCHRYYSPVFQFRRIFHSYAFCRDGSRFRSLATAKPRQEKFFQDNVLILWGIRFPLNMQKLRLNQAAVFAYFLLVCGAVLLVIFCRRLSSLRPSDGALRAAQRAAPAAACADKSAKVLL